MEKLVYPSKERIIQPRNAGIGSEQYLPDDFINPKPPIRWESLIYPEEDKLLEVCKVLEPAILGEHLYDKTGHDIPHVMRVMGYGYLIAKGENLDPIVVSVASGIHDIHRVLSTRWGMPISAEGSMPIIETLLAAKKIRNYLSEEQIEGVLYAVRYHDFPPNLTFPDHQYKEEGYAVQDADRIDGMGILGLYRNTAYCMTVGVAPEDDQAYQIDVLYNLYTHLHSPTAKFIATPSYSLTSAITSQTIHARHIRKSYEQ